MLLRTIFSFIFCFVSLVAMGQNCEWRDGRPECFVNFSSQKATGRDGMMKLGSQATAPLRSRGTCRVPVVLVEFQDVEFITPPDATCNSVNEFYHKFCNGTMDGKLYKGHGSYGSIRDYFVMQSDSVFFPEFDIIGPVVLDNDVAYYGNNADNSDPNSSKDTNFGKFKKEALRKAMTVFNDWSRFDNDGNGTIDLVFFIYAGFGEHNTQGQHPELLWPKEMASGETIDGVTFGATGITCECRPIWNDEEIVNKKTDGIGVFVHELSHALGLPDFYDVKKKPNGFGMDLWSVMDYGQYASNGFIPGNYTAYERDFMGWSSIITLSEPCVLTIPCFADGGTGYKIVNDANPDEYYIIENRQSKGWDEAVGKSGHGLQVTHVDYQSGKWSGNVINNDSAHQRMTIIAANNCYKGTNSASGSAEWKVTLAGNLYPGSSMNYELTDESTPAARVFSNSVVYTGATMHKPLRNIRENEDKTVTVCYCTNGQLATMEAPEVDNVMMDRFDAHWPSVENATKYAYELWQGEEMLKTDIIVDTTLFIDNLLPSSELKLRVKAMADKPEDYIDGEWSMWTTFSTLSDNIQTASNSHMVEVYNLSGMSIGRMPLNAVSGRMQRRGVYILRFSDGTTRKVMF